MRIFYPTIVWSFVIFILSVIPGVSLPESFLDLLSLDKFAHIFVYGVLAYLLLRGLSKKKTVTLIVLGFVVFTSSLYGVLMEIVQFSFFPHRYFEVFDIIANIIGSFAGVAIFKFIHKFK
ncbi:MAG: VanZ family protein [Bacteroidetes bacterium]|nr:VanZ family protein [Bacteroidota bacterium]